MVVSSAHRPPAYPVPVPSLIQAGAFASGLLGPGRFSSCGVRHGAIVFFLPKTEMATDRNAACHVMR